MDCTDLTSVDVEELLRANLPAGALIDGSTSGLCEADERLQAAAAAAAERGTATPLLKEELRLRILERRMKAGKPEIKPDATVPKDYELTPAEKEKKERRKEQNRRAARKCREKKKNADKDVQKTYDNAQTKNSRLRSDRDKLQKFTSAMEAWLRVHMCVCSIALPSSGQQEQFAHHHQEQAPKQRPHQFQQQQRQQPEQRPYQQQQQQKQPEQLPHQFQQQQQQQNEQRPYQQQQQQKQPEQLPHQFQQQQQQQQQIEQRPYQQQQQQKQPEQLPHQFQQQQQQQIEQRPYQQLQQLEQRPYQQLQQQKQPEQLPHQFQQQQQQQPMNVPVVATNTLGPGFADPASQSVTLDSTDMAIALKVIAEFAAANENNNLLQGPAAVAAVDDDDLSTAPPIHQSVTDPDPPDVLSASLGPPLQHPEAPAASAASTAVPITSRSTPSQATASLSSSSQPLTHSVTALPLHGLSGPSATITTSSSNSQPVSAPLDLPGYPFSTRKRSADGRQQVGEGNGASSRKRSKSAAGTHPPPSPPLPPLVMSTPSAPASRSAGPPTLSQLNSGLAYLETGCGSAPLPSFTPSPSASPSVFSSFSPSSSSHHFRFPSASVSSVTTPPHRVPSHTPPPPYPSCSSSLTPPPGPPGSHVCSLTPPPTPSPGGHRVVPGSELTTPAPSPALSIPEERANDDERLWDGFGGHLGPFASTSGECEDECLSSRSLTDLLKDGFFLSSSQED